MVKFIKKTKFLSPIRIIADDKVIETIELETSMKETELEKSNITVRSGNDSKFWDRKSNELEVEDGDTVEIEYKLFYHILAIIFLPIVFGERFLFKYIGKTYPEYAKIAKISHFASIILFFVVVVLILRFAKIIRIKKANE